MIGSTVLKRLSWLACCVALCAAALWPSAAQAQWTAADAESAFNAYNNAFYFNPSGDNYDYRTVQGSTNPTSFWVSAEEIELAIDAYRHDPTPLNRNIVTQLCNGFEARYGQGAAWSSDSYDDDLMWATIAFTRAYRATGNAAWLTDAEQAFAVVWGRGYDTKLGGGIWWNSDCESGCAQAYKNSPANWTFVIAGNLLYASTRDEGYLRKAAIIYGWARKNLYEPSSGEVFDGVTVDGVHTANYSYNYGIAVGALTLEHAPDAANKVAVFLMNNVTGGVQRGYNILPNLGQGGTDGGGFNGIALRWIGFGLRRGSITDKRILPWAQANVSQAWSVRDASDLSWNDWFAQTPAGGLYSWDCSDTVVGMMDIPAPVQ